MWNVFSRDRAASARRNLFLCVLATTMWTAQADSAEQQKDPTVSAVDAFGETIGFEQIGLYNSSEIRGFDPQNSGAYRIDGAYFARAAGTADGAVSGISVNVGVNATRLSYPSPSGIVNIHLREFSPGDRYFDVDLNSYAWFSPTFDVNFAYADQNGILGIAGGVQFLPAVTYPDGSQTEEYYFGAVPGWRLSDSVRLRALISYGHAHYDGGLWGNVLTGDRLPPVQSVNVLLPPRQATGSEYALNLGLLLDGHTHDGWKYGASAFYSVDGLSYDFTTFEYDATRFVHATLTHIPEQKTWATSFEARISHDFSTGAVDHQIAAAVRYRHREAINSSTSSFDMGIVDAKDPHYPSLPSFTDDGRRSVDTIDQEVASLDYAGAYWKRLELRAGVDVTRHGEKFSSLTDDHTASEHMYYFPHASLVYSVTDRLAGFASYVRGLEDSGVAPTFAVNANQVLPPVLARQVEFGLRDQVAQNLTLIAAAFEVQKPTPGLRPDGVFSLVGEERHRGIELSLSGQLSEFTRVIFGAVAMDQRLSGPLVASGDAGPRPVGTAPVVVAANVVQTLPFDPDWSVDAQLRWTAGKFVDAKDEVRSAALPLLNLGLRHDLHLGGMPATLRMVATNILDVRDWSVHTSGAISPVDRPTVWATLTIKPTER